MFATLSRPRPRRGARTLSRAFGREKKTRRYGGAYVGAEAAEAEDPKTKIDAKCGEGCTAVWAVYKECEARIEEKVRRLGCARPDPSPNPPRSPVVNALCETGPG